MNNEEIQQELLNAARRVLKSIAANRTSPPIHPGHVHDHRINIHATPPYSNEVLRRARDEAIKEASYSSGLPRFILAQHAEWLAGQIKEMTGSEETTIEW